MDKSIKVLLVEAPSAIRSERDGVAGERVPELELAPSRCGRVVFLVGASAIYVSESPIAIDRFGLVRQKPAGQVLGSGLVV